MRRPWRSIWVMRASTFSRPASSFDGFHGGQAPQGGDLLFDPILVVFRHHGLDPCSDLRIIGKGLGVRIGRRLTFRPSSCQPLLHGLGLSAGVQSGGAPFLHDLHEPGGPLLGVDGGDELEAIDLDVSQHRVVPTLVLGVSGHLPGERHPSDFPLPIEICLGQQILFRFIEGQSFQSVERFLG